MNIYTACFYTDAEYATDEIETSDPQEPLEKARAIKDVQNGRRSSSSITANATQSTISRFGTKTTMNYWGGTTRIYCCG